MFWGRTHQFAFCIISTISERLAVDALLLYTEFSTLVHRHSIEFQDFPKVHFFPLHKFEVINIFSCRQKLMYYKTVKCKIQNKQYIQINSHRKYNHALTSEERLAKITQNMFICSVTYIHLQLKIDTTPII